MDEGDANVRNEAESEHDSLSPDENEEIERARTALEKSPTFYSYKDLISVLRKAGDDIFAIRKVRNAFAQTFPLPASNWIDWADDELMMVSTPNERLFVARDILQRGLKDYTSVSLSKKLLQLQIDRFRSKECTSEEVDATFHLLKRAGTTAHFSAGAAIWELYLQFLSEAEVSGTTKSECLDEVRILPIRIGDEERMDTSEGHYKLSSTANMQRSSGVEDLISSCDVFEAKLTEAGSDPSEESGMRSEDLKMRFVAYAAFLANNHTQAAKSVWERCIQECFLDNSLWMQYAKFCRDHCSVDEEKDVLERSVRNVPWDLRAWCAIIYNILRRFNAKAVAAEAGSAELVSVLATAHPHVYSSSDWDEAMRLSIAAVLCYNGLNHPKESKEAVFATVAYSEEGSVQWGNCKFVVASVCIAEGDMKQAVSHIEDVIAKRSTELQWWQRYVNLLVRARVMDSNVRDVFRRGIESLQTKLDVETFGSSWIDFEASTIGSLIGDESSLELIENRVGKLSKATSTTPRQTNRSSGKATDSKESVPVLSRKRKSPEKKKRRKEERPRNAVKHNSSDAAPNTRLEGSAKPERNVANPSVEYEVNTVFINNLPYRATEEDLRQKFGAAGEIKGIRIPKRGDGAAKGIAYIEFGDSAATASALALHQTPVCGREVWVRRSKPPRNSRAKTNRPKQQSKRSKGHKPRLTLNMGIAANVSKSRMEVEEAGDHDEQMTDAAGAQGTTDKKAGDQFKTQDDFRTLLLGKK